MKHSSWLTSRATFVCLCLLALLVLVAEYKRYLQDAERRSSSHSWPSMRYGDQCVHHDVIEPLVTDFDRITQILHVSADLLDHRIVEQVTNWNGPVSMTVVLRFVHQYSCTLGFLRQLRRESPAIARHLKAHIIFPGSWTSNCSLPYVRGVKECDKSQEASITEIARYPANVARNVARIFSSSKYIIITDYEHLFSEGFEAKVRAIAARRLVEKPHTMLVYRIFEIDEKIKQMPRDKSALYKLFLAESAVVFHARYYPGAHEIDGLLEWFQRNSTADGLFVKNLSYDRSNWEPQFVSLAQIPFHDENFPFQLRDNTVLRWEMCRANYSIDVLDDVFMFHRGIKGKSSGERSRAVQKENSAKFEVALERFIERMDREYPATKKKCPAPER